VTPEPPKGTACKHGGCKEPATLVGWVYGIPRKGKWTARYKRYQPYCDEHFAETMLGLMRFECKSCRRRSEKRFARQRAPQGVKRATWLRDMCEGTFETWVSLGAALSSKPVHCTFCRQHLFTARWVAAGEMGGAKVEALANRR
jgi:hypothetical protein